MDSIEKLELRVDLILDKTNTELRELLIEAASAIENFPGFLGMETVQAIEIDPITGFPDRGCIVITPEGFLKELSLSILPGASTLGGYEQSEQFKDLDLPLDEETVYLYRAIRLLTELA
tara:strand:- start:10213 stop:10569 length:357 start_codon:yes stop_codon:yes gene_type:complete